MEALAAVAGFALGFGASAVLFSRVVVAKLDRLHQDNVSAAKALEHADVTITRKVEEQNMASLTKRLDEIEARSQA
jgi:hypothetical protein